jgi:NADH:ubiquinone oxidoreductase subunit 6 (subunit J)
MVRLVIWCRPPVKPLSTAGADGERRVRGDRASAQCLRWDARIDRAHRAGHRALEFSNGASTLDISSVLFFLLAIGVVGAGMAVVTLRNIIHSAVAMMICFGSLAGMYALLGAPIVAAAQVLIYLGAISVLILFAIMLTQAGDANLPAPFHRQLPLAAVVALTIIGLVGWAVVQTDWALAGEAAVASVDAIANALFTDYALPFEIISLLILVAIIGAIFLARRPEEDERAN